MLVVLDSSVLVAGFRSRRGASFRTLELLRDDRFQVAMSVALALEYEAVLVRQARELDRSRTEAIGLVDFLCGIGSHHDVHFLWRPTLRDPRDEFILDLRLLRHPTPSSRTTFGIFAERRRSVSRLSPPLPFCG